jgi:hypothetical protein
MNLLLHICTLSLAIASGFLNKPLPDNVQKETSNPHSFPVESIKIGFYNVLTTHVTDKEPRKSSFPQYRWEKRKKAFIQLIRQDHPDILGLCELDLRQVKTIESECLTGGMLENYRLYGFSAQTNQTIDEIKKQFDDDDHIQYGEFIALLVNADRIEVENLICHPLPGGKRQKWKRILVEVSLNDKMTKTEFVCLFSHFDDKNLKSRQLSALEEITYIQQFEEQNIPWFSLGDRNWYRDEHGEKEHLQYLQHSFIGEFRDNTQIVLGPPGTFPGHLRRRKQSLPPIVNLQDYTAVIDAPCVSTGYTSETLVEKLAYYAKLGEFDPATGNLLPLDCQNDLVQRNFVSDHYLFGGVFLFRR